MSDAEAARGDTYIARMRERLDRVHVILYVVNGEWTEGIQLEMLEATPINRPPIPIINVLARGYQPKEPIVELLGDYTVDWCGHDVVKAIRTYAIPASADELSMTLSERRERREITRALKKSDGDFAAAANLLGISNRTLRRKRMFYIIR
jgi:hypothetical protein